MENPIEASTHSTVAIPEPQLTQPHLGSSRSGA
jgi:hypothetical protein